MACAIRPLLISYSSFSFINNNSKAKETAHVTLLLIIIIISGRRQSKCNSNRYCDNNNNNIAEYQFLIFQLKLIFRCSFEFIISLAQKRQLRTLELLLSKNNFLYRRSNSKNGSHMHRLEGVCWFCLPIEFVGATIFNECLSQQEQQ